MYSLGYPVKAYIKHNGFLGIAFYDQQNDKVVVYSKGGGEPYSSWARQILQKDGNLDKLNEFYKKPEHQSMSVLFEIVDPVNDPHIVKYAQAHTYPLAVVDNDMSGHVELQQAEKFWHIDRWLAFTAHSENELKEKITVWEQLNKTCEGLVLYGQNKMLKYKTKFYHKAKELRGALGNKHKKRHWYYGAEQWYDYCEKRGIREFTPDLAVGLHMMDMIVADDKESKKDK